MDQPNCQISQRAARIDAQSWTEMPRTVKPIVVPATTLLVCSAACRMGEAILFDSHVVGGVGALDPGFISRAGHDRRVKLDWCCGRGAVGRAATGLRGLRNKHTSTVEAFLTSPNLAGEVLKSVRVDHPGLRAGPHITALCVQKPDSRTVYGASWQINNGSGLDERFGTRNRFTGQHAIIVGIASGQLDETEVRVVRGRDRASGNVVPERERLTQRAGQPLQIRLERVVQ